MKIYDSHTHLNDDVFYDDVPAWLARADHYNVVEMNIVGSNTKLNDRAIKLAETYDELHAIIGWHPEDAKDFGTFEKQQLVEQLDNPEVVAIGEIGLDYHWDTSPVNVQKRVFQEQLEIAAQVKLPVSIHNRDAFADTYQILAASQVRDFGGVMHSFNGSVADLNRFLDLGMYVSYSGVASFKNAKEVHESVVNTPLNRLLVETDAPYLAPTPHRGQQNEPGYTSFVVKAIAKLKEISEDEVAQATFKNAKQLFRVRN